MDAVPEIDAPGKGLVQREDWAMVATCSRQRAAAFCPGLVGSEAGCVSLHLGDDDTTKQEPQGRKIT